MAKKKTAKQKSPRAKHPGKTIRYFEFIAGKSRKFWEIQVAETDVTVRYGRIGADGQTKMKSFDDSDQARAHAEKLIDQKTGKGYVETDLAVSSMKAGFEQQLVNHPDDVETLAVYADWLIEQGDPRGDFINVQLALEDESLPAKQRKALRKQEELLLETHEAELLGPFASFVANNPSVYDPEEGPQRPNLNHRFAQGMLHSLDICWLTQPLASAIRDAPETRFLRQLVIAAIANEGYPEEVLGDDEDVYSLDQNEHLKPLLDTNSFDSLQRFQLGTEVDMDYFVTNRYGPSCHAYFPQAVDLVKRMPRLRELHLLCKDYQVEKLFAIRSLTELRILRLYHLGVRRPGGGDIPYEYPLDVLARNKTFSQLTHLLFHPHHEEYHHEHYSVERKASFLPLEQLEALIGSPHLKKLTHLQFRLSNMGDDGCSALADSDFLRQLKWLDLRHGCITDEGARVLAACPDLKNLEHLDLSRNGLTQAGIDVLQNTGVPLRADAQQTDQELAEEAYLYEGDSE